MKRPFYFLRRALRNLRGAPAPAIVTAATIAIAVFLFGAFLLLAGNLARVIAGELGGEPALTLWVARDADARALRETVRGLAGVERVELIPPREGLEELAAALGESADVLEGIDAAEVLPAVLVVSIEPGSRDIETVRDLASRVRRLDGVASVDSGLLWLERFAALSGIALWTGVAWGVLLAAGSLLVVGNAARLAALTRRGEIEVLHLVGASDGFIVMPFFWEGVLQGIVGSALGLGLLYGAFSLVERALAAGALPLPGVVDLAFPGPSVLIPLAAAGPVTGALGSFGAALRFVRAVSV